MDCRDVRNLLHPYVDGELDLVRHLQIEHHLAECAGCAGRERGLRLLRDDVASGAAYYKAPEALYARLQAEWGSATTAPGRQARRRLGTLVAIAAVILLATAAAVGGGFMLSRGLSAEDRLADQVIAGHIRSLQVTHLTDVASTDRHTVKPWFLGKLDFAPRVPDLSPNGYELFGGRLDYLADRPVAALVYYRRQHAINLFTWPAAGTDDGPARSVDRQGFHVRSWQSAGMMYWAISDVNPQELDAFVRLFQQSAALP